MAFKINYGVFRASGSLNQDGQLTVANGSNDLIGSTIFSEGATALNSLRTAGQVKIKNAVAHSFAIGGANGVKLESIASRYGQITVMANNSNNVAIRCGVGDGNGGTPAGKGFMYIYSATPDDVVAWASGDNGILSGSGDIICTGAARMGGNLTVGGNLTAQNTMTLNVTTVRVEDTTAQINSDSGGSWAGTGFAMAEQANSKGARVLLNNVSGKTFQFLDGDGSDDLTLSAKVFRGAATGMTIAGGSGWKPIINSISTDNQNLAFGLNRITAASGDRTLKLATDALAGLQAGDRIRIKFDCVLSEINKYRINSNPGGGTNANHSIDGATEHIVESPYAAVDLVFLGGTNWSIC